MSIIGVIGFVIFGIGTFLIGFSLGERKQLDKTIKALSALRQPPPCDFGQEDERSAAND